MPFIDWFYTADRLNIGGWMIVDDTDLVTGTVLADFMRADPKWQEASRFTIYKKLRRPIHDGRWWDQPYVKDTYPTASVKVARRRPPGPLERAMTKALP